MVPSQIAISHHDEHSPNPSALVPGAATIRQQAGSVTPHMSHAARHGLRGRFGDPQTYTEMEPDRVFEDPAQPVPFYTKRTIAVYMRQSPFGKSVTQEEIGRLMQLINRFKPMNLRVALIIAPDSTVEYVYPPDADIQESWIDNVLWLRISARSSTPRAWLFPASPCSSQTSSQAAQLTRSTLPPCFAEPGSRTCNNGDCYAQRRTRR